ncbi:MAG: fatty acid desaturase [Pseudobdellovibrio sp.]
MMQKSKLIKFPTDITILRKELKDLLPAEAFLPQKNLLLNFAFLWILISVGIIIVLNSSNFLIQLAASITLGLSWTIVSFYAHLFIHGHIPISKKLQNLIALPCLYFAMISPTGWSHWHSLHHRFGTLDENVSGFQTINWVKNSFIKNYLGKIKPNQNTFFSFIYLFFWKALAFFVNQIFYFLNPRFRKQIDPAKMAIELFTLLFVHVLLWRLLSWNEIFYIEIIPWALQNLGGSLFVVTNHHPKLIANKCCFRNICSIHLGNKTLDSLFLNMGYHIEHHVFPECSPYYLPFVGKLLNERYPNEYKIISLTTALKTIFLLKSDELSTLPKFKNNRKIF